MVSIEIQQPSEAVIGTAEAMIEKILPWYEDRRGKKGNIEAYAERLLSLNQ